MPDITMICLANSRKIGGRCVAGLAWDGERYSNWVRPISPYGSGELYTERLYSDRSDPQLLDVIMFDSIAPRPSGCHVEDVLVNRDKAWQKIGSTTYSEVSRLASSSTAPLWADGGHTTYGTNDSIDATTASSLQSSLRLIVPDMLILRAAAEGWANRRKVRGEFSLGTTAYVLAVTDPRIETEFAALDVGSTRTLEKPLLCISISELFEAQNAHYKLIAGVVEA